MKNLKHTPSFRKIKIKKHYTNLMLKIISRIMRLFSRSYWCSLLLLTLVIWFFYPQKKEHTSPTITDKWANISKLYGIWEHYKYVLSRLKVTKQISKEGRGSSEMTRHTYFQGLHSHYSDPHTTHLSLLLDGTEMDLTKTRHTHIY